MEFYDDVMRWLGLFLIVAMTAMPVFAEDWHTEDGKTYENVVVVGQEEDGVRITFTGGAGKIPYYELTPDLQKRFGLDPDTMQAKRVAAEKAQQEAAQQAVQNAADEQKRQQLEAADQMKQQQDAALAARTKAQQVANSNPAPSASHAEPQEPYPGAKLSYDKEQDVCYLDSQAIDVLQDPAPAVPDPTGQGSSLALRITTEGEHPEIPSRIEATFRSFNPVKKFASDRRVVFAVDGAQTPVDEIDGQYSATTPSPGRVLESFSFYVSPDLAKSIIEGKNVKFSVGHTNYVMDPTGISVLRKYVVNIDKLPPPTSEFNRLLRKLINRIPAINFTISAICQDIIVGSFGVFCVAVIVALVIGVGSFLKM